MPKLKCGVDNCTYYQDNYCKRERIKVAGSDASTSLETCCGSYKKRRVQSFDTEFASFDAVNEYLSITCESENCVYNNNQICKATKIKIGGSDALNKYETECESFISKYDR